jgi:ribosomal-protein-alanine N-acetyltransferase
METAINHAKSTGVTKMFLEVADQNIAAKALYAALGFTQLSRRRHYYANGDDALLLGVEL